MDVGASTGGFTDCLLQRVPRRVSLWTSISDQLAWKLRKIPRPRVSRNAGDCVLTTFRNPSIFSPSMCRSFPFGKVLPGALAAAKPGADLLILVKRNLNCRAKMWPRRHRSPARHYMTSRRRRSRRCVTPRT